MEDHFNFLIDEELVLTKDSDLLGTKVYSDSLAENTSENIYSFIFPLPSLYYYH